MMQSADHIARQAGDPALAARVEIARSTMAFWEGEWKAALDLTDSARRMLGSLRVERAFDRNVLDLVRTRSLEEIGLWHLANSASSEMYADAVERNDVYASVTACLNLGMLAFARGDVAAARRWADQAVRLWPGRGMQVQHLYALRVQAYADLCEGQPDVAWDRLESSWESIRKGFHLRVSAGRVDVFALRGRIAATMLRSTGDVAKWTDEVAKAVGILEKIQRPDARAHASLFRAALGTHATGIDSTRSRELALEAAERYRAAHMGAMAGACDYFTDANPDVRARKRSQLEQCGMNDPDLWIRGFVPLGA
jgi:ATP/maltotriose-dependent transcriptional regulator MalT